MSVVRAGLPGYLAWLAGCSHITQDFSAHWLMRLSPAKARHIGWAKNRSTGLRSPCVSLQWRDTLIQYIDSNLVDIGGECRAVAAVKVNAGFIHTLLFQEQRLRIVLAFSNDQMAQ